ncbi:methyladenine glycosylase domain-containing protein [Ditylenchus destructor]|nr:methyladenine glycosylase domain-containing protein [Ditylenchus destructor]
MSKVVRCAWLPANAKPDYVHYHDHEWGVPVHDDQRLFEMLILEGAQAGLSWYSILKRRDDYRAAFKDFNVSIIAEMSDSELNALLEPTSPHNVIRNRLKVYSARKNALTALEIQREFNSLDKYLWSFMPNGEPRVNWAEKLDELAILPVEAQNLSDDLKKRGMSFVGPKIIHAFMQAVGMLDDHMVQCFRKNNLKN